MASRRRIAYWLLGSVAVVITLLLALLLFADSDIVKAKLRTTIETQTGGKVRYQQADFSLLPRPSITFHQIKLDLPEQIQGTVGFIQASPDLFALLSGQVHLAELILDSPEVSLKLSRDHTSKEEVPSAFTFSSLQNSLVKGFEPLTKVAPDLALVIKNGTLTLNQDKLTLGLFKNATLIMDLDVADFKSLRGELQGSISEVTLHRNGHKELLEDLELNGVLRSDEKIISLSINSLTLAEPSLQIKGDLVINSASPVFEIDLNGVGLDVDEIRRAALNLAGDTSPTKEIFDYLRGGMISQISFQSQGDTASALGDLKNIVIRGHLQAGGVSIPEIELELTDVIGDVTVIDGVLEGTRMSTRLEGSSGRNGTLKVALHEGSDLFQLELILNADLEQAQRILKRIVENPEFMQLVDNVTNLKGTSTGKLMLGDSLNDINARVDVTDLNLSADYLGLPFPVNFTKGQFSFTENQVELKDLNGTFGRSEFSDIECIINWENVIHLNLNSGQFGLVMDEIFPWVASLEGAKDSLGEIKNITGRLDLTSLSLKGDVDTLDGWQFAAIGSLSDIGIETPRFPAKVELTKGEFSLDAEALAFQNLNIISLDSDLLLSGAFKGLPLRLEQAELSLDGEVGQDSVAWLRGALEDLSKADKTATEETEEAAEVAEASETAETAETAESRYTLRTPLSFSETRIQWQPDNTTSFKGNVSVAQGPSLTFNVDYLSEQLQIKKLIVKDQYSDADIAFTHGQDDFILNFNGNLHHKTLESLFIDQQFGTAQLKGELVVNVPLAQQALPMARGHLEGEDLVIPLPSDHVIALEQITLTADGSQVNADVSALSWNEFTWTPVKATVDFKQDQIDVRVKEAKLCGIDTFGVFSIANEEIALDITLEGKELDVVTSYSCLTEGRVKMTGTLNFSGKISAQGEMGDLISSVQGPLEMDFKDGSIEQSKLLTRTLEVLNVTEIVKGRLPDLGSTGFSYSGINMQGHFLGSKLMIDKVYMDGETLDVLGQGELDFVHNIVDVELLAAPFKTVDTVVKNIPGVNYLLAGSLVTIPVSVKGDLADPRVRVLSASSVGSSLLNLGGRIIKSPLKLIETLTPGQGDAKK